MSRSAIKLFFASAAVLTAALPIGTSNLRAAPPRPGAAKPAARPRAAQPATQPRAAQPATQPGAAQPATQPGAAQPAAQPAPRAGTAEPAQPAPRTAPEPRPARRAHHPKLFKPGSGLEVAPGSRGPSGIIPYVRTTFGSAKLLTLLQARMNVPLRGTAENWQTYRGYYVPGGGTEQNIDFRVDRIRLILTGHFLSKNLRYMFQGDAAGSPFMLDVKFTYSLPWVPGLSITFGRFLSVYSLIMSRLISRLETTEYPIFMSEGGYAPWRDFGVQIKYSRTLGAVGTLNAYLGIFNGEVNSWTDTNDMKDFLLRVDLLGKGTLKGLWVGAYAWLGFPSCTAGLTCVADEALQKKWDTDIRAGLFAEWQKPLGAWRPHVMAEGYLRKYTPRAASGAEVFDSFSGGLWLHLGALLGKYVEPMVRVEYLTTKHQQETADLDGDLNPESYAKDWAVRLSAGLQVYFNRIHSHLKINYIYEYMGADYARLGQMTGNGRFGRPQWTEARFTPDPTLPAGQQLVPAARAKQDVHMFVVQAVTEF